jgi:hypothetical protein
MVSRCRARSLAFGAQAQSQTFWSVVSQLSPPGPSTVQAHRSSLRIKIYVRSSASGFPRWQGAFLVGVAGAKWITNEVDKRLLKETVKVAVNNKKLPKEQAEHITEGSARQVLHEVTEACATCAASEAA